MLGHVLGAGPVDLHAADRVLSADIVLRRGDELVPAFRVAEMIDVSLMLMARLAGAEGNRHAAYRIVDRAGVGFVVLMIGIMRRSAVMVVTMLAICVFQRHWISALLRNALSPI